ncbi:MAG: type II toxin-antitoxin system HicB family antitoxin [Xanthomonadaceae bacterium]|nr:type II toxin-antitoxin system HicB family antitoxin [Xanthomonadaceae bacterium]
MKVQGMILKDSKSNYWAVEIPFLCLHTQGKSRKDALDMAQDAVFELIERKSKISTLDLPGTDSFYVSSENSLLLIAAGIKQRKGQSYRAASKKIGSSSPNAVKQYTSGTISPSLDKLEELIQKLENSDTEIVISITSRKKTA